MRPSFKGPISWGLSASFLVGVKDAVLFSLFPDRVDGRDWMTPEVIKAPVHDPPDVGGGYWFDFVADTGDSGRGETYSIAYLLHGDLFIDGDADIASRDDPSSAVASVVTSKPAGGGRLPRGAFLLAGNDTAYPVSDERTVRERFIVPFDHAHLRRFGSTPPPDRVLLGIPGNHDWYDSLDGFNRLFRRPPPERSPSIPVRGFKTEQPASYFALELPDDCEIWAVDDQAGGRLDARQKRFFAGRSPRKRLVLATASSLVEHGERAPLAHNVAKDLEVNGTTVALWLAGDLHHYARYDGFPLETGTVSVVTCGLGGASLHAPARGTVPAKNIYPGPEARWSVIRRLISPVFMHTRSTLWVAGAVLGLLLGAAPAKGDEARSLVHALLPPWLETLRGFLPWTFLALAGAFIVCGLVLWTLNRRVAPDEKTARLHSPLIRVVLALLSVLGFPLSLMLVALLAPERNLGSVVADASFYGVLGVALLGFPWFLGRGLAKPRPLGKSLGLILFGFLGGLAFVGSAIIGARVAPGSSAILGALAAAAVGALVLPVLVGVLLAIGLRFGSRRETASSFAMIDEHQAFIRFRLRTTGGRSTLTGFVIAVTRPVPADELRRRDPHDAPVPDAKIQDVFSIDLG